MNPVEDILKNAGIEHFGFVTLERPLTMDYYKSWLQKNYHADMTYLERHSEQKENPQKLLPHAHSAIVVTQSYFPPNSSNFPLKKARVALYARQADYHDWFQEKLNLIAQNLKNLFPQEEFIAFTDSKPVLERDLAVRAGLGWVGKNTCVISEQRGSLFFIGEIYTTLKLKVSLEVAPDRCGTCTRCIDICPTQALVEPRILDANKCISYWTIEAKTNPPQALRNKLEGWYFGCDLCQTVCPWNQKIYKTEMQQELAPATIPDLDLLKDELKWILTATPDQLKMAFAGTPLLRAKPWAHKRNAILVAVHYNMRSLKPLIQFLKEQEELSEIAHWAIKQL